MEDSFKGASLIWFCEHTAAELSPIETAICCQVFAPESTYYPVKRGTAGQSEFVGDGISIHQTSPEVLEQARRSAFSRTDAPGHSHGQTHPNK